MKGYDTHGNDEIFSFVVVRNYFSKHALRGPLIADVPHKGLFLNIVIPAFNEEELHTCLLSLQQACRPDCAVEIIVVINFPDNCETAIKEKSRASFLELNQWTIRNSTDGFRFYILLEELTQKDAGVGLARKIGMDEAARRFDILNRKEGVIVCLDADCVVSSNYLTEIENHFRQNVKTPAASLRFEHPYLNLDHKHRESIVLYELFLRYYINALRFADFPFAFQTIGSSMAVRNVVYQKQGGMNKRKAGEDFYFLQKIFPLGNFSEINNCCVYPSPRKSERVPFGTGKAIGDMLNGKDFLFYDFEIFQQLKVLFGNIKNSGYTKTADEIMSVIPAELLDFLVLNDFESKFKQIKNNVSSAQAFVNRFFCWFDGFLVLKAVHFLSDRYFPRKNLLPELLKDVLDVSENFNSELILDAFRNRDFGNS